MASAQQEGPARVLVTDHVFNDLEAERQILSAAGLELIEAGDTSENTLIEAAENVAGIIVCYAPITEAVVEAAAKGGCKVIARYGIGYDNVAVETATRLGITVTNVPDYCLTEVADHTIALMLASLRGVIGAGRDVATGGWQVPQSPIRRLSELRLALIGAGGIGRMVISRAQPFGFEIVAFDPYAENLPEGVKRVDSVEEAVAEADVISLHTPLTDENQRLINAELIAKMRRAPLIVNTSRGGLVDTEAATEALRAGRLSGLALDVTEVEPLPENHPLRTLEGATITPHMAFYSVEAQAELQRRAAEDAVRVISGQPARNPVNAPAA